MDGKNILLFVFILVLLYIVYYYVFRDNSKLVNSIVSAQTMTTINPSSLATNIAGANQSNFTYSIWFNINDWNYRYGEPKVIFGRMSTSSTQGSGSVDGINGIDPCPVVVLDPVENNLIVSLGCFPGADSQPTTPGGNTVVHTCKVSNIPIQKWVNLLVSVYGRSMDVYIDGKLVKTCLLPGVAKISKDSPVYVTPNGGFSGWTAKMQYWPNATDPQTAWNIYADGYGASWFSTQYKVQLSLVKDGNTTASVEI